MEYVKETTILVPKAVHIEARKLHKAGMYEQALTLLDENKVVFDIYDEKRVEAKLGKNLSSRFPKRGFRGKK